MQMFVLLVFLAVGITQSNADKSFCSRCNQLNTLNYEWSYLQYLSLPSPPQIVFTSRGQPVVIGTSYSVDGTNEQQIIAIQCTDIYCTDIASSGLVYQTNSFIQDYCGLMFPDDTYFVVFAVSQGVYFYGVLCRDIQCTNSNHFQFSLNSGETVNSVSCSMNPANQTATIALTTTTNNFALFFCTTEGCNTANSSSEISFDAKLNYPSVVYSPSGRAVTAMAYGADIAVVMCTTPWCSGYNTVKIIDKDFPSIDPYAVEIAFLTNNSYVVSYTKQSTGTTLVYCLNLECSANFKRTFGNESLLGGSLVIGPDGYPIVGQVENINNLGLLRMFHCLDSTCSETCTVNVTTISPQSIGPTTINYGGEVLIGAFFNTSLYQSSIFCGPYVTSMSPDMQGTNLDVKVTLKMVSGCPQFNTCRFDNITVNGSVGNNSVSCVLNSKQIENVTLFLGPPSFDVYAAGGLFQFVEGCAVSCGSNGHCNLTTKQCVCDVGYWGTSCELEAASVGILACSCIVGAFALFGLLISILYVKYGTKSTYEAPTNIRRNFVNFLTLVSIPLEFGQMMFFSTNLRAEWARAIKQGTSSLLFRFPNVPLVPVFWATWSLTLVWCFLMLPYLVRVNKQPLINILVRRGTFEALYNLTFVILIPLATFLFFPVVQTLLLMLSCVYWGDDVYQPFLEANPNIHCWGFPHTLYAIMGGVVLLLYYPLAVYAYPKVQQLDKKLDIKFKDNFLFILALSKVLLCVTNATFPNIELPQLFASVATSIVLFISNLELAPCNVPKLNPVRSASYAGAAWSGVCSLWAYFASARTFMPLLLLGIGWLVILVVLFLTLTGKLGKWSSDSRNALVTAFYTIKEDEHSPLLDDKDSNSDLVANKGSTQRTDAGDNP